jgi:hypothetical protein
MKQEPNKNPTGNKQEPKINPTTNPDGGCHVRKIIS